MPKMCSFPLSHNAVFARGNTEVRGLVKASLQGNKYIEIPLQLFFISCHLEFRIHITLQRLCILH